MAAGKTDGIRSTGNRASRWRSRPALEKHPNKIIGRKARSEEVAGLVEIDRKTGPIGIPIHDGKRTKRAGPGLRQRQNQVRDQPDPGQNERAPQNGAQKENPGRIENPSKEQPPRRGIDRRAGAKTKTGRATQERGGLLREWGCSAGRLAGGCGGYGLYTATRVDGRPRYAPPRPRRPETSTNERKGRPAGRERRARRVRDQGIVPHASGDLARDRGADRPQPPGQHLEGVARHERNQPPQATMTPPTREKTTPTAARPTTAETAARATREHPRTEPQRRRGRHRSAQECRPRSLRARAQRHAPS